MPSKNEIERAYAKYARQYDAYVGLYKTFGLKIDDYRRRTIELLHLREGDTVVEIGCGTGLNFQLVLERIGPKGQLIGIDLTEGMLECARLRVEKAGWKNIELIQSDIEDFEYPQNVDAVYSTGVFGYLDDPDEAIRKIARALGPEGRFAIFDLKRPESLPALLFEGLLWLSKRFGVERDYFEKRPWEAMENYFEEVSFEQMYGGMVYVCAGSRPRESM